MLVVPVADLVTDHCDELLVREFFEEGLVYANKMLIAQSSILCTVHVVLTAHLYLNLL